MAFLLLSSSRKKKSSHLQGSAEDDARPGPDIYIHILSALDVGPSAVLHLIEAGSLRACIQHRAAAVECTKGGFFDPGT